MPVQTPEEFLRSIQGPGLLVVRGDTYFFIPLKVMNEYKLPDAFQKGATEIPEDYFKLVDGNAAAAGTEPGKVYKSLDRVLGEFRVVDGVRQAIWLVERENLTADSAVSKSEGSDQVLFKYEQGGDGEDWKIVVDMSKGGRLSTEI